MRRNVASQIIGAQMVSATDGSAFTGTVTLQITVDGGTQTASAGTGPTHEGNGFHSYITTAGETNGSHVAFTFLGTGAVPATVQVYPMAYSATGVSDANSTQFAGQTITAAAGVTLPSSVASPTNITAATGITLTATTGFGTQTGTLSTVTTTTTATNLTNERGKYALGAVWIGSTANTNTTNYTDGILTNPVSTVAAAKSIADSLGLKRFWVQAGTTATLAADMAGYVFEGRNWIFATSGSRAFTGSGAIGGTNITGTYTSAGAVPYWENCEFGATVSIPPSNATQCTFLGTTTLNAAGNYDFIDCASIVAGTSAPVFAVPAGTVNISFRRWSGGIRLTGLTASTTVSIDMVSGGTVTLEGTGATVVVRGMATGVTNSMTPSAGTVTTTAVLNQTVLATPTNITAGTIATVSGNVAGSVGSVTGAVGSVTGAVGSVTGSVGSIATGGANTLVDLVWDEPLSGHLTAGTAGALGDGILYGTAATGTLSTTQATTNLTGYTNSQLIGRVIIWLTGAADGEASTITAYAATGGLLTFDALIATPANGDTFKIV